jgi:uncharacterized protein (TIGR02118 family)
VGPQNPKSAPPVNSTHKEKKMIRLTALWPKTSDSHFDMDYYLSKHVPMTKARLEGLGFPVEAGVDEGLAGFPPGEPAPYAAIGYLLFENMEDLQKGLATHGAEMIADIPNFTNVQPQIQIGSVVLGVGTAVLSA